MADRIEDKEREGSSHFKANGLEHFSFNSKTIISWGVLSGLIGLFVASITVYQSFGTNVDERISNHRELNRKLDKHEYDIQNIKDDSKELGSRITDIERYINSKGRK